MRSRVISIRSAGGCPDRVEYERNLAFSPRALGVSVGPFPCAELLSSACARLIGTSYPRARFQHRLKVVEELVTKPVRANLEARTDQVSCCCAVVVTGSNACVVGIV